MISRNDFCNIMGELERLDYQRDDWMGEIEKAFGGSDFERFYENSFFNLLINTIEIAMDINGKEDEFGYSWITWWIYEANYGKDSSTVDCKGKKFFPKTSSDLYDIILFEKCDFEY